MMSNNKRSDSIRIELEINDNILPKKQLYKQLDIETGETNDEMDFYLISNSDRQGYVSPEVLVALISGGSVIVVALVQAIFQIINKLSLDKRVGKQVRIVVEDKNTRKVELEFSANFSPDEIKEYAKEIIKINEPRLILTQEEKNTFKYRTNKGVSNKEQ